MLKPGFTPKQSGFRDFAVNHQSKEMILGLRLRPHMAVLKLPRKRVMFTLFYPLFPSSRRGFHQLHVLVWMQASLSRAAFVRKCWANHVARCSIHWKWYLWRIFNDMRKAYNQVTKTECTMLCKNKQKKAYLLVSCACIGQYWLTGKYLFHSFGIQTHQPRAPQKV